MTTSIQRVQYDDGQLASIANDVVGQTLPAAMPLHAMAFKGQAHDISKLSVEEDFDVVIVGAGISSLAAAYFYRRRFGGAKKILLIETLADFGGHAKRNEFVYNGKTILGYGGSESFQSPSSTFSGDMKQLMRDLNIDLQKFDSEYFQHALYAQLGLSKGTFLANKLATGDPTAWVSDDVKPENQNGKPLAEFVGQFPLSDVDKRTIVDIYSSKSVTLDSMASDVAREAYLKTIDYISFIKKHFGASDDVAAYFRGRTLDFFGVPADFVPTLDATHYGLPGVQGIALPHHDDHDDPLAEPYIYHFPDGNASLARLLVRSLIPASAGGHTMSDIVLQKFNYAALDVEGQPVRLRLNAAVVVVANDSAQDRVDVGYVKSDGSLHRIAAHHVVLGGFNMAIAHMFKELAPQQAIALKDNVKVPMLYVNVLVKNWKAWVNAGVHEVYAPGLFFARMKLDYPVSMGGYACARSPDEPVVIHCVHIPPMAPGTDSRAALRAARKSFFAQNFAHYEASVKSNLTTVFGPHGFAESDIVAITVNRWAHGYAYNASTLDETEAIADAKRSLARQRVGNVVIANSDAGWSAYAHSAVDEAARAVRELK